MEEMKTIESKPISASAPAFAEVSVGTVEEEHSGETGGLNSVTVLTSLLLCWPGTAFSPSDYSFPF